MRSVDHSHSNKCTSQVTSEKFIVPLLPVYSRVCVLGLLQQKKFQQAYLRNSQLKRIKNTRTWWATTIEMSHQMALRISSYSSKADSREADKFHMEKSNRKHFCSWVLSVCKCIIWCVSSCHKKITRTQSCDRLLHTAGWNLEKLHVFCGIMVINETFIFCLSHSDANIIHQSMFWKQRWHLM